MSEKKVSLFTLFWTFAKIGSVTFGGGYAMLPILQKEVVSNKRWCTESDLLDYFAVGQCTPGIIAVNTSTFIGYNTRGNIGGIVATLGFIFPSFVLIAILVPLLMMIEDNQYVKMALTGIRVAVCALITVSVISLSKKSIVDFFTFILMAFTLTFMLLFNLSPILFVIIGIIYGIAVSLLKQRWKKK